MFTSSRRCRCHVTPQRASTSAFAHTTQPRRFTAAVRTNVRRRKHRAYTPCSRCLLRRPLHPPKRSIRHVHVHVTSTPRRCCRRQKRRQRFRDTYKHT
jgi:hypothetical protein